MFMRMLKSRLSLMLKQNGFLVSMTLMLAFSIASFAYDANHYRGSDISEIVNGYQLLATTPFSHFRGYFEMLFPFLAVMPFCFSYLTDRSRNNICIISVRGGSGHTGRRYYYLSGILTVFIGSFLIIFIPMLINLLLNAATFPLNSMLDHSKQPTYEPMHFSVWKSYIASGLFYTHPLLHCLLWTVIPALFSGVVGVFVYSLSFLIKRFKLLLFLPFYAIHYVLSTRGDLYYMRYICYLESFMGESGPDGGTVQSPSISFLVFLSLIMLLFSAIIIAAKLKKDEL